MAEAVPRPSIYDDVCVICCYTSDFFCVGQCDHRICFECGTRIRVLCQSNECSICRAQLPEIYVVSSNQTSFSSIDTRNFLKKHNNYLTKQYGFRFENEEAFSAVTDILAHVCTLCKNEPTFRNFQNLSEHMRRVHELYYCDLCVEHLKLLSYERKCYNRSELARHRRCGDPDDRSHTGHPLCEFCDERYLDDDFLFRHLRRDHFFCHFCDADGKNKFYSDTEHLKEHFRTEHYLCEVGQCKNEHLGVAFRHEIDFKAHKATSHSKDIQKNELKKELQVHTSFHFGPTPARDRYVKPARGRADHPVQRPVDRRPIYQSSVATVPAASAPAVTSDTGANVQPVQPPPVPPVTQQSFDMVTEDFPSLSQDKRRNAQVKSQTKSITAGGKVQLSNVVAKAAGKSLRSGSLGENDFPTLTNSVTNQPLAGEQSGSNRKTTHRNRRNSRSASPHKTASKSTGFRMVDDDEDKDDDDSVASSNSSPAIESPKEETKKILQQQPEKVAGSGKPYWGPPKLTAGGVSEAEFPLLPSKASKKKASATANKAAAAGSGGPRNMWSQKVQGAKVTEQQPSPAVEPVKLKFKDYPPLFVSLPKSKARARLVAQNKQRPSADDDGDRGEKSSVMPKIASYDDVQSASFKSGPRVTGDGDGPTADQPPRPRVTRDRVNLDGSAMDQVPPATSQLPPPPGLSLPLPPGLDKPLTSITNVNGNVKPPPGLTPSAAYTKPKNFQTRNVALLTLLKDNLTEAYLSEFKTLSGSYQKGEITGEIYYKHIRGLLGAKLFRKAFVELLCLLPDISKQNDLLTAQMVDEGGGVAKAWHKNYVLDSTWHCEMCRQIIAKDDYSEHCSSHVTEGSEEEFPVLS